MAVSNEEEGIGEKKLEIHCLLKKQGRFAALIYEGVRT
jgi:hypothetical protein